jgi:hypothetical protein
MSLLSSARMIGSEILKKTRGGHDPDSEITTLVQRYSWNIAFSSASG